MTPEKKVQFEFSTLNIKVKMETRRQFHQHFTSSFYANRSQKCKKDSQVKRIFALSGYLHVKPVCKHVGEIDPRTGKK